MKKKKKIEQNLQPEPKILSEISVKFIKPLCVPQPNKQNKKKKN